METRVSAGILANDKTLCYTNCPFFPAPIFVLFYFCLYVLRLLNFFLLQSELDLIPTSDLQSVSLTDWARAKKQRTSAQAELL